MAGALQVPMTVSAKVVPQQPVKVASLGAAVSFEPDHTLEPGVHVHWALPDALARARMDPAAGAGALLFPGVPDLWLVTRMNPPSQVPGVKRGCRAWVVNSRGEPVSALEDWTLEGRGDRGTIHTAAGVLPSAADAGAPGWGVLAAEGGTFDPLQIGFYPACRTRFGLHDPLDDIVMGGKVSYSVVGWYRFAEHDPLHMAGNRRALLERWQLVHDDDDAHAETIEIGAAVAVAAPPPAWTPQTIELTESERVPANVARTSRFSPAGSSHAERSRQLETMTQAFDMPDSSLVDGLAVRAGPDAIRCHGALYEVDLTAPLARAEALDDKQVSLYPTVQRAMASLVSASPDENAIDAVEALLGSHENQTDSLAGVVDLPGALHAATFQGVPGRARVYACIEIHPGSPIELRPTFRVDAAPVLGQRGQGHWPSTPRKSASPARPRVMKLPDDVRLTPRPARPEGPSDAEVAAWIQRIKLAFGAITGVRGIDARFIRLQDNRRTGEPLALGPLAPGQGSDGSAAWLDMADPAIDATLRRLLRTTADATIELPHRRNLHRVPGPRWYRSWSPQLVLLDVRRGYKYGYDGRFRDDGRLRARVSGDTLTGLTIGAGGTVRGADLLADADGLFARPGLPPETRSLIYETLLLDPQSAEAMAAAIAPRATVAERRTVSMHSRAAVHGLCLARDGGFAAANAAALSKIALHGTMPSEVAWTLWSDPLDPLFVNVSYAHARSSVADDWALEPEHVDCTPRSDALAFPSDPARTRSFDERTPVTAGMLTVLDSKLSHVVDEHGKTHNPEPTFKQIAVVSAALTGLDANVFAAGLRERSGALHMTRVQLVDMFGFARPWEAQPALTGKPSTDASIELVPRLPYWGRLTFRVQSAVDPQREATPRDSPICGILLPDFLEQTLEVFAGDGTAIGQIRSDFPQVSRPAAPLAAGFELHPWVAADPAFAADPLGAIADATLRGLVASLVAQTSEPLPADAPWFETGLTAMMRVVETVRRTLDPAKASSERLGRLFGEPILVVRARVGLEATAPASPTALRGNPEPLQAPPALPAVPVRIGDVTRPDDGVLGCFFPGEAEIGGRFAPVSSQAAAQAVVNQLAVAATVSSQPAAHAFIRAQANKFTLTPGESRDLVVLCDPRGGMYATCGLLPRKKITLPIELIQPALARLEPSFRVGPVLTVRRAGSARPFVPASMIPGLASEFVYRQPATATQPARVAEAPVPPVLPLAELPEGRVTLDHGWLRLFAVDEREHDPPPTS